MPARLLFFSLLLVLEPAFAREPSRGQTFSAYVENDSRSIGGPGSDQGYSNGLRFSYISARDHVPPWAVPLVDTSERLKRELRKTQSNFGLALGHQIYTPNNTQIETPIENDRPYAAWLFLAASAHFKSPSHGQYLEASLGVVGPEAGGKTVQNGFHRIIGQEGAQGWANQLGTEPTLQLSYQQRVRFFELHRHDESGDGKYLDAIPYFGGSVGNVLTAVHVGGMLRFGTHIPDDLGPTRPSSFDGDSFISPAVSTSTEKWSVYGFVGGRGIATARNIFLDGNSFRRSPRVTKYPLTGETEFGAALQYDPWSLVWRFVTRSPEFREKGRFNSFASVSLSYSTE